MNAPVAIPPAVAAHAERVLVHLPGSIGADLETRARLLLASDTAAAALWGDTTEEQAALYDQINRLGQLYAYSTLPTEALKALLQALRRMSQAATYFGEFAEQVQARETDARG